MGSSAKAGNDGVPATPRDGAPIELTGLLYATLSFLTNLHQSGKFPFEGVKLSESSFLPYSQWAEKIKNNFESYYFIPEKPNELSGYYKDNLGSKVQHNDIQLRPNMCIALAVAPELFNKDHAIKALEIVKKELMPGLGTGQIGIRTLNDQDSSYRNFYDNSNDSNDFSIAHGFSYHNGPEWVWPIGYYLLSVLYFTNDKELVMKCLTQHLKHFETSL